MRFDSTLERFTVRLELRQLFTGCVGWDAEVVIHGLDWNFRRFGCPTTLFGKRLEVAAGPQRWLATSATAHITSPRQTHMDRIPTTSDGALGGNRQGAANPMVGATPGCLGGRRVSEALHTPRPGVLRLVEPRSVVRPAETHVRIGSSVVAEHPNSSRLAIAAMVPHPGSGRGDLPQRSPPTLRPPGSLRAGQGPVGSVVGFVSDSPATSSGASAASGDGERRVTLPEPDPSRWYAPKWGQFVYWCRSHNVQYWPASPEAVAEFLTHRAKKWSVKTLNSVCRAISHTHRSASLTDPCATGLVKEMLKGLAQSKERQPGGSANISGSFLDAAGLQSIRKAALLPRWRGNAMETAEEAAGRGQVDRALCSVVLEAGLSCKQAAALEWQDLGRGAGASPTLTIRTESSEAGEVIGISATARDDLEAIARVRAPTEPKIFPIEKQEIETRIRLAARVAGLEELVANVRRHRVVRAETTDKISATDRTRECKWRAFSTWCTEHGAMALPASAETVAQYLREQSKAQSRSAVSGSRAAIAHMHINASHENPCTAEQVVSAMQGIRPPRLPLPIQMLTSSMMEAIRATAQRQRRHGPGWETRETARRRGLADIALCSLLYETKLTVRQVAMLNWRQVEQNGEGEARLTVASTAAHGGGTEVRVISKQATRDLEAIRGESRQDGGVFNFNRRTAHRRVVDAFVAAGLGEPSAAGPSRPATAGLVHTVAESPRTSACESDPPGPRST